MSNIIHYFSIEAPAEKIYEAVTTQKGLASWWTTRVDARSEQGYVNTFRFGPETYNKMKVVKLDPPAEVHWECVDGADEWIGTRVRFEIEEEDGKCWLRFTHGDWRKETDFYALCNHHWGRYLDSLKELCETGEGKPYKADDN